MNSKAQKNYKFSQGITKTENEGFLYFTEGSYISIPYALLYLLIYAVLLVFFVAVILENPPIEDSVLNFNKLITSLAIICFIALSSYGLYKDVIVDYLKSYCRLHLDKKHLKVYLYPLNFFNQKIEFHQIKSIDIVWQKYRFSFKKKLINAGDDDEEGFYKLKINLLSKKSKLLNFSINMLEDAKAMRGYILSPEKFKKENTEVFHPKDTFLEQAEDQLIFYSKKPHYIGEERKSKYYFYSVFLLSACLLFLIIISGGGFKGWTEEIIVLVFLIQSAKLSFPILQYDLIKKTVLSRKGLRVFRIGLSGRNLVDLKINEIASFLSYKLKNGQYAISVINTNAVSYKLPVQYSSKRSAESISALMNAYVGIGTSDALA